MVMARPGCGPGKFGDGDFASLFFGLRFGEAGPRDFRIGEDDGGNRVWLEGDFVAGDGFDGGAAFVHGFVGEHRFAGDVADGVDGGVGGLALAVDFDESLLIDFDFCFVEAGDFGIGAASDGHQHAIEDLLFFFYVGAFEGDADAGLFVFERFDGGVEQDRGEEFFETLVQREDEVAVGSGEQAGEHFDAGHFGAEGGVDGAEFEPDVAAADDEQRFRNVGQIESAGGIHEARAVESSGWARRWGASRWR